ncbi:hypothetical protein CCACVL1_14068 [Corchorus capsularis]|uniref:Receptor-like serine/threonine-protein kinase n=1 Tax=Corchorus capsularis TaxID=210143 RepID=A0A1R3I8F2_COCAP|nr:hypothetical protein CCACVL1_14068 [Corchorus capsularis]
MNIHIYFSLFLHWIVLSPLPCSSTYQNLSKGSSLSVENPKDVLVSPNGTFSAGFYPVGDNAYAFAIWFSKPKFSVQSCTVVWMANRDQPVNGRRSKLSLLETGNLILTDAAQTNVWATHTSSFSSWVQLQLNDYGNLVLSNSSGFALWQSFDFPTDTLLPLQSLTRSKQLVSRRRKGNYSSGFYKLFFDDDNVLRLLFDGPEISSVYWPNPWAVSWENGRSTYNSTRMAVIDSLGNFSSSDNMVFKSADYGANWIQRRLTIDYDEFMAFVGKIVFVAMFRNSGRKCSCPPGYKMKNQSDWSLGCQPEFNMSLNASEFDFIRLAQTEFFGYDFGIFPNQTLKQCKSTCLNSFNCKGFQYKFNPGSGFYDCFPKVLLQNGQRTPNFNGDIYLKLPKALLSSYNDTKTKPISLKCWENVKELDRSYVKTPENGMLKVMLLFASALGGVEFISIFLVWCFLFRATQKNNKEGYGLLAATGFKRFTFDELKDATSNFKEEIGRGGGGIVYKGKLPDGKVVAVKRLNEANQGEAEFLAEVNTIGKLNHMNLIQMWGFCAEKKHRLLVYEFMENGSLAEKLTSHELDWQKRYDIALGTAKGLAYLHEECLEWILHCDVKPQNILLDSCYQPKVSDFGLSKLLDRSKLSNSSFSKIRGTRGYMAPEWLFNRPITSKVDVYSYAIVVLEMVTGMSPINKGIQFVESIVEEEIDFDFDRSLTWVKEKKKDSSGSNSMESWTEEIVDPMLGGNYDKRKIEILVEVAINCVQEDKDARPTMSQVVERLLSS